MRRRAKTNADILSLVLKTRGNGEQTYVSTMFVFLGLG